MLSFEKKLAMGIVTPSLSPHRYHTNEKIQHFLVNVPITHLTVLTLHLATIYSYTSINGLLDNIYNSINKRVREIIKCAPCISISLYRGLYTLGKWRGNDSQELIDCNREIKKNQYQVIAFGYLIRQKFDQNCRWVTNRSYTHICDQLEQNAKTPETN